MKWFLICIAVVMGWAVLVAAYEHIVRHVSARRWKKTMESVADNTVFAGLALFFGSLVFWMGSAEYDWRQTAGGLFMILVGLLLSSLLDQFFEESDND